MSPVHRAHRDLAASRQRAAHTRLARRPLRRRLHTRRHRPFAGSPRDRRGPRGGGL